MAEMDWLTEQFEQNRGHLRGVAYRMLGSLNEADDAVQEAWLRLNRSDSSEIENLGGWLTTVVSRVCLDMLRSRSSRKEDSLEEQVAEPAVPESRSNNPEQEALMADSVGLALMVVLERLNPAERLAFVLHDMFDLPFEEIATIVDRSPAATRQLASRARRQIRGIAEAPTTELAQQREAVTSFLSALRAGDLQGMLKVLDPDLIVRIDKTSSAAGQPTVIHGAERWASQAITLSRGARSARPMVIDGAVGLVAAPEGHLFRVLRFIHRNGKIAEVEIIGDSDKLEKLDLAVI